MMTVLLARHGETAWNRNRRAQGWAPVRLNDQGREQAAALGAYLGEAYELDRIHASDLDRTAETARIVSEEGFPHLEPVLEAYWRERDLGVYQGLTYEELSDRYPAFALVGDRQRDPTAVPEGGESLITVRDRVLEGWRSLTTAMDGSDDTGLVVAHGGPIKLLLGHLQGLDPAESIDGIAQDNCAVNEIRVNGAPDAAEVVRSNVSHFWE